jgi:hypothetical protein
MIMAVWSRTSLKDVDFDGLRKEAARLRAEEIQAFWSRAASAVLMLAKACRAAAAKLLAGGSHALESRGPNESPAYDA